MKAFANVCDRIAATAAKLEKISLLAEYLRGLENGELRAAARFLSGRPLGAREDRKVAIGGRTIVRAAKRVWGFDDAALSSAYRATGDLGDALGRFARAPADLGLFHETLTPATLAMFLEQAADATGKRAGATRMAICERILAAAPTEAEARYAIKVLTGDLRIGLREGLVIDAIAKAFDCDPAAVRRAVMAAGDLGTVAFAAREGTLAKVEVGYGRPIGFMLASPIPYGSESYRELAGGAWLVEDKYDGIRAQVHRHSGSVRLFSRTHAEVGASYPEVLDALIRSEGDFIIDGEIVARKDGTILPFRYLQSRLQRKDPDATLRHEVPVAFVAFDLLASGERFLIDQPLAERRAELAELLREEAALEIAPWQTLEPDAGGAQIAELFEAARARGNEGIMFKRTDAAYTPGRRGKSWLKLKRELSTLDCVVVGVEWGHGRRKDVLSDYTFAVRGDDPDALLPIGKAYSGLTDEEIAKMTRWFLAHRLTEPEASEQYRKLGLGRYEVVVEPEVIVEIAFDIIQRSSLHASGYSLRFPRIVRLRPDKNIDEIDTIERVREIEAEMLARENV